MNSRLLVKLYSVLPRTVTARVVRLLKPTYNIGVVALVFDSEGRILVLRHTYHRPDWRLPGGLMERGESPEEVAVREVMEEAYCRIEAPIVLDAMHEAHTFDVAVLARLVDEFPFEPNAEIDERKWVRAEDLPALPSSHLRFIRRAISMMQ
ncbi:NUDIX hydrolase [Alicyclobacillus dauci]|uniref:NUDIX domain-containing protein n=1 Tax=Alicyclobacillus dauci TaxID=1475485 RepID=A0ABY6Z481_9BACL|nr:NUDIX domain-containing protein [Alicyclobacillus dauci]WAH37666.1 NUDIX domain-containing protein [Alicyclobacillus dauci]